MKLSKTRQGATEVPSVDLLPLYESLGTGVDITVVVPGERANQHIRRQNV